ncbi:hypothetical protein BRARA_I02679 [Brassica rapa]|uniref:Replication protein A 70 kDa DNA-binding subunit B/D first OB fold domain-containing protein n=1 Tax=Brassica campestris TaxID=3711 RepID=A0A397XZL7_BRACM|nr:hypothetical protein BRARA_I02679 [Brassica rapa]
MKATPKLSYLFDIRLYKPEWWIQVKVIHTWKQYSKFGETMETIFADKKHLAKKNSLLSLGAECRVGEWKNLENFVITLAGGGYRPTNHPYKLSSIDMFPDLVEFETILSGHLDNNLLIGMFLKHVVGKAIDIEEKKKKIEFNLKDIKQGNFTDTLESYIEEAQLGVVVCLIRFAKIGSFRSKLQISNAFDTSQLLINPPIEETALKEM